MLVQGGDGGRGGGACYHLVTSARWTGCFVVFRQGFGGHTLKCQAFVNNDDDSRASKSPLAVFRR